MVSFVADGAAVDAPPLFAYGQSCIIYRDATPWFYGRVTSNPRGGSGRAESVGYRLAGPWWYLENKAFQQLWGMRAVASPHLPVPTLKGRAILCQGPAGERITTGAQMVEAIEYVIDRGAPIALGTIEGDVIPPLQEVSNITCAEVIRHMCRWTPDITAWFDYATEPHPTLHIRRRAAMPTVSVPIGEALPPRVAALEITPRHDLQASAVIMRYERTHDIDGVDSITIDTDIYPPGANADAWDAVELTVELGGAASTWQRQWVRAEVIAENGLDWWRRQLPWLRQVSDLNITSGAVAPADGAGPALPRYMIEGSCPAWMDDQSETMRVTAVASGTLRDENDVEIESFVNRPLECTVMGTNLSTRLYAHATSVTLPEETPVGLAQQMYAALSVLHWQGTATLTAEEVADDIAPGRLLSFTGALPAWETMAAQIQEVTDSVDDGTTTVAFGPPVNQGAQDRVELMRVTKRPVTWRAPERSSGQASDRPQMEGGTKTPGTISASAPTGTRHVLLNNGLDGTARLDVLNDVRGDFPKTEWLKGDAVKASINAEEIHANCLTPVQLREVRWCKDGAPGEEWYVMLMCSEPYQHTA
ncbi:hypothetical protein DB346_14200 [Verrucomicrobia bacterium LW23]|nr:hypothetical protein DB346_14200 [Verrucomicrobia bacterium LW23]